MKIDTGYLPQRNQQHSYAAGGKSSGKANRGGSSFDQGLTQVRVLGLGSGSGLGWGSVMLEA